MTETIWQGTEIITKNSNNSKPETKTVTKKSKISKPRIEPGTKPGTSGLISWCNQEVIDLPRIYWFNQEDISCLLYPMKDI